MTSVLCKIHKDNVETHVFNYKCVDILTLILIQNLILILIFDDDHVDGVRLCL
jgi:hypothetical protein